MPRRVLLIFKIDFYITWTRSLLFVWLRTAITVRIALYSHIYILYLYSVYLVRYVCSDRAEECGVQEFFEKNNAED